jgi:hypothetical protein
MGTSLQTIAGRDASEEIQLWAGSVSKYKALLLAAAFIAGCGGAGGGGIGTAITPTLSAPLLTGANSIAAPAHNVLAVSVGSGRAGYGYVNLAYATVTICAPGSESNCQAIDNILVDTGSTGLRIVSSALSPSVSLQLATDSSGNPVAECTQFAGGTSWGPVKLADVKLAGEQASSLAVQVIGDPDFASVPANCAATGAPLNTRYALRANGVLGVGAFRQDCGNACVQSASPGIYYACPASGCQAARMPLAEQLQNPVSKFAVDNNGIILELPAVAAEGAASVSGALVFGIGTQANNGLGSASVLTLNPATGALTTAYNGHSMTNSFFDSGSNALYFQDSRMPACSSTTAAGCYCPDSTQNLSAIVQGTNGTSVEVNFSVANADSLQAGNPGSSAYANLASPKVSPLIFSWGLPFFYGRNVFVAMDGAHTPGGPGPYIAF